MIYLTGAQNIIKYSLKIPLFVTLVILTCRSFDELEAEMLQGQKLQVSIIQHLCKLCSPSITTLHICSADQRILGPPLFRFQTLSAPVIKCRCFRYSVISIFLVFPEGCIDSKRGLWGFKSPWMA